jgi:hypothetical protein
MFNVAKAARAAPLSVMWKWRAAHWSSNPINSTKAV